MGNPAMIDSLTDMPYGDLSFEAFCQVAIFIPVIEGKGKSWKANSGPSRWLTDNSAHSREGCLINWKSQCKDFIGRRLAFSDDAWLDDIRREAKRIYLKSKFDQDPDALPLDQWVSKFVASALKMNGKDSKTDIEISVHKGGRPFILCNMNSKAADLSQDSICRMAYEVHTGNKANVLLGMNL